MTQQEMTRLRRQMQRRIRVVLAQRRLDAPDPVHTSGRPAEPAPPPGRSAEPAPED
jgi:hypothetical protein